MIDKGYLIFFELGTLVCHCNSTSCLAIVDEGLFVHIIIYLSCTRQLHILILILIERVRKECELENASFLHRSLFPPKVFFSPRNDFVGLFSMQEQEARRNSGGITFAYASLHVLLPWILNAHCKPCKPHRGIHFPEQVHASHSAFS